MEIELQEKFNYDDAELVDKLAVVGEMEHLRRHAIRSAMVATEDEDIIYYYVLATQIKRTRRKFMANHFKNLDEKDWCLVKSASSLRQLAYEVSLPEGESKEMETLVDSVFSHAFKKDMTGCKACADDKEAPLEQ